MKILHYVIGGSLAAIAHGAACSQEQKTDFAMMMIDTDSCGDLDDVVPPDCTDNGEALSKALDDAKIDCGKVQHDAFVAQVAKDNNIKLCGKAVGENMAKAATCDALKASIGDLCDGAADEQAAKTYLELLGELCDEVGVGLTKKMVSESSSDENAEDSPCEAKMGQALIAAKTCDEVKAITPADCKDDDDVKLAVAWQGIQCDKLGFPDWRKTLMGQAEEESGNSCETKFGIALLEAKSCDDIKAAVPDPCDADDADAFKLGADQTFDSCEKDGFPAWKKALDAQAQADVQDGAPSGDEENKGEGENKGAGVNAGEGENKGAGENAGEGESSDSGEDEPPKCTKEQNQKFLDLFKDVKTCEDIAKVVEANEKEVPQCKTVGNPKDCTGEDWVSKMLSDLEGEISSPAPRALAALSLVLPAVALWWLA